MRTLLLLATAALAGVACAQEAEPSPPVAGAPAALFPDTGPLPAAAGARHGRQGRGGRRKTQFATDAAVSLANSDPLEVRVAYRKDKTLAMAREPGLRDILLQAEAARTDDEKRAFLREYYTKLYATVRKIDPSPAMKAHVNLLARASEQQYDPKRRSVSGEDDLAGVGRNGGRNRR